MEDTTPKPEDKPAVGSVEPDAPAPKKTTKARATKPRATKPRSNRTKPAAKKKAAEEVPAPPAQAELDMTPSASEEAPKQEAPPETSAKKEISQKEESTPSEESPAAESNDSSDDDDRQVMVDPEPGKQGEASKNRERGSRQRQRGNGHDDQGRGRNKRGRGRNAKWQKGGRGGSGHPAQPGPAEAKPSEGDLPNPERFADLEALEAVAQEISSGDGDPLFLDELYALNLADLTAFAREYGATFEGAPNRNQLLLEVFKFAGEAKKPIRDRGYIDVNAQGAFIVHQHVNYRLYPEDPYLAETLIKRYGLKRGHKVEVLVQAPQDTDRCPAVVRVEKVMGMDPEEISKVTPFEELVPYYPLKRILLESAEPKKDVSMRTIDILTPIGFGQRGLIVAPPRTGKTVILQNIANSVSENFPDYTLILLLIDERPEEVTDFKRHTKGEVVASTFDESPENHVHCAEMVGEKARRLVEQGEHVVILLDSITRLARAYNALTGNQGKTMSGGLESNALQKPKRFFGAARNIEGAGSLTIMGTALVDTGSRMDEIIFEEFKGTGNMELHLDRGLVERRIFPAINIDRSGTRKEELIYHPDELEKIHGLRRAMQGLGPIESMEMLIKRLRKTKSNAEFLFTLR